MSDTPKQEAYIKHLTESPPPRWGDHGQKARELMEEFKRKQK